MNIRQVKELVMSGLTVIIEEVVITRFTCNIYTGFSTGLLDLKKFAVSSHPLVDTDPQLKFDTSWLRAIDAVQKTKNEFESKYKD